MRLPCVQCDQAALTGESLPVKKFTGDTAFSGSSIKQVHRLSDPRTPQASTSLRSHHATNVHKTMLPAVVPHPILAWQVLCSCRHHLVEKLMLQLQAQRTPATCSRLQILHATPGSCMQHTPCQNILQA